MRVRSFTVLLLALGVIGTAVPFLRAAEDEGKEVKIKFSEAPAAVQKTITEQANGVKVETLDKETSKDGKVVYEADVKIDGTNYEIAVAEDGKLIHKKVDKEEDENKGKGEKEKD